MAFEAAFEGLDDILVKKIDETGLWVKLQSQGVLKPEHISECKAEVYNSILELEKILFIVTVFVQH